MTNFRPIGIILALLTGSLWGCSVPLGKILAQSGTNMLTVVFLRSLVVCVVVALWILLFNGVRGVRFKMAQLPFLISVGIMNIIFTAVGFLLSLKYLSVPVALLIHYLFPIATIAGEFFIFHQPLSRRKIIAALLVLWGLWVGMLQSGATKDITISAVGILWGLLAVIGLAGQSLMGKIAAQRHYDYKVVLLYSHIFGTALLGLIKFFAFGMNDVFFLSCNEVYIIVAIGMLGGVLAYAAYYISLKYISSSLASLLCTSEIIVGMLAASVILFTPPSGFEILGAGIIIFAISISVIPSREKADL
jgi:drug/metabolite transporter (DMT)-like permease